MRKIRRLLFSENVLTEEYAAYLTLLVSTASGMVFSEELFTYFVYHEKVVKGTLSVSCLYDSYRMYDVLHGLQ